MVSVLLVVLVRSLWLAHAEWEIDQLTSGYQIFPFESMALILASIDWSAVILNKKSFET